MTSHLYRTILPVPDIDEAARFYAAVFGITGIRVSPGRHYFNLGGTILALYNPGADGDQADHTWRFHPAQYQYFAVEDLDETLRRVLESGGTMVDGIAVRPWGERSFYAQDPFGSPISFVDPDTLFTGESA